MSKRPSIDLLALTTEQAAPMPEAVQRVSSGKALKQISSPSEREIYPETIVYLPRNFRAFTRLLSCIYTGADSE